MLRHLSPSHWQALSASCREIRELPARTIVTLKGERVRESLLLVGGMMGRYVPRPVGARAQMVALQVLGDFVDLHGLPLGVLDHEIRTVTDVQLAVFDHADLLDLIDREPDLGMALWSLTMIDAAIHRHWAFRMAALRATVRLANLFCELETRLALCGAVTGDGYDLPLTQIDLADACGMTAVHVNRVLRDLREGGCCTLVKGRLRILDGVRLHRLGAFDPAFLYLPD